MDLPKQLTAINDPARYGAPELAVVAGEFLTNIIIRSLTLHRIETRKDFNSGSNACFCMDTKLFVTTLHRA